MAGAGALDASWHESVKGEAARLSTRPRGRGPVALTVNLDLAKAYERVPLGLLALALLRLGVHPCVVGLTLEQYMAPRFVAVSGAVARAIEAICGLIAGCAFAVKHLGNYLEPRIAVVAARWPGTKFRTYVDDFRLTNEGETEVVVSDAPGATADVVSQLQQAGLEVGLPKCTALCSSRAALREAVVALARLGIEAVDSVKDLGIDATLTRRRVARTLTARVHEATKRATRAARVAAGGGARQALAVGAVISVGTYGVQVAGISASLLGVLTAAVARVLGSGLVARRCRSAVIGLAGPVERDPRVAVPALIVFDWAKRAWAAGRIEPAAVDAWHMLTPAERRGDIKARRVKGPVGALAQAIGRLGWNWASPGVFTRPGGKAVSALVHGPKEVRALAVEDASARLWQDPSATRRDAAGAACGVDLVRARRYLGALDTAADYRSLKAIHEGAFWAYDRLFRAGKRTSAACQDCGCPCGDVAHIIHDCPRWEAHRDRRREADLDAARSSDPGALILWARCLVPWNLYGPLAIADSDHARFTGPAWGCGTARDGPEVWTDGAGAHPTDSRLRRCGWAAVICVNGRFLAAFGPLASDRQTVARAELMAAVVAAELTTGCIVIVTDCRFVADGVNALGGIRSKADLATWAHADLWHRLRSALDGRTAKAKWIPGHATRDHVAQGAITALDRLGNHAADVGAGLGVLEHPEQDERIRLISHWDRVRTQASSRAIAVLHAIEASDSPPPW